MSIVLTYHTTEALVDECTRTWSTTDEYFCWFVLNSIYSALWRYQSNLISAIRMWIMRGVTWVWNPKSRISSKWNRTQAEHVGQEGLHLVPSSNRSEHSIKSLFISTDKHQQCDKVDWKPEIAFSSELLNIDGWCIAKVEHVILVHCFHERKILTNMKCLSLICLFCS